MESVTTILLGLLRAQLNISEEQAAALLFPKSEDSDELDKTKVLPGALDALLAKDTERVKALKGKQVDKTAIYNKAFNDAKTEILPKAEKALAKEYGIELNGMKLSELVGAIVENKTTGKSGEVTDETVKKHPLYLSLERSKSEEIDQLTTTHEEKIKELETGFEKKETFNSVKETALAYFEELNPVLSKDATKASNQKSRFVNRFSGFNFQRDGDNWLMLDEKGERLEDNQGHPITVKKQVSIFANEEFDFKMQNDKDTPGNRNTSGGVAVPTSEEEYNTAMFEATTVEEREQITAAYEGS